ncbi:MAG: cell envelope integrity protein TolA [Pseudomonadota bacterium]|nr:cell envelope integrity protein TolA [Pseudomonadota bacterium]
MNRAGPFQHISSGGMSLLVHGAFVGFLLMSISWRSLPHLPVEAELWSALPEPPAALVPALPPEPPLEALPAPELPKIEAPQPEVAKPALAKPDIALERAEKRRIAKEASEQLELQRQAEEQTRIEKENADRAAQVEKLRQVQLQRAQARREMEQELTRQAREELEAEETQLRGVLQRQQASSRRQARLVGEFQDRIRGKILGYLRLPHNLTGNPEVIFRVALLPNGEVVRVTLVRGSGQPAYDQEMERAILKASPLPLPNERDVAAVFRDDLILKFRPREDASGGG